MIIQKSCFHIDLLSIQVDQIKTLLLKADKNSIFNNKITFEGFLTLIYFFIEKDNPESCWQILRKFDYDDNLDLKLYFPVIGNDRYELSTNALNFLRRIFTRYDSDDDGKLTPDDIKRMSFVTNHENIFYNENILKSPQY